MFKRGLIEKEDSFSYGIKKSLVKRENPGC